ncbi:hypothetical protein BZA05DRAFT_421982 [Tricharina praecox]|uniref:uncharacterized protein n=1 Tax=Tricharina praecox TaxID=43433 RepID=UPI00221EA247|nr:uncharacterized protein BZA05DRAFT_421982 [Tricharina praecox]KAI5844215.1 hypothetical protein BZA05DRAFT_421982 [Tricharina praecox]
MRGFIMLVCLSRVLAEIAGRNAAASQPLSPEDPSTPDGSHGPNDIGMRVGDGSDAGHGSGQSFVEQHTNWLLNSATIQRKFAELATAVIKARDTCDATKKDCTQLCDGQVDCRFPLKFTQIDQIANGQIRCIPPCDPDVLNTLSTDWAEPGDVPHPPVIVEEEWRPDGIPFPNDRRTIRPEVGEVTLPLADPAQRPTEPSPHIEKRSTAMYDGSENVSFARPEGNASRVRRLALIWVAVCIIIGAVMFMC